MRKAELFFAVRGHLFVDNTSLCAHGRTFNLKLESITKFYSNI